jgi:hypothetical protein
MRLEQFFVVGSAMLSRALPLALGFLIASKFEAAVYADAVLWLTAANLAGALPTLAITPHVLRSQSAGEALHLASRGVLVGIPLIVISTSAIAPLLGNGRSIFFLVTYTSGVFMIGVSQAILNQARRNKAAFRHAAAVSTVTLLTATVATVNSASAERVLVHVGVALGVGSALSLYFASRKVVADGNVGQQHVLGRQQLWDAIYSGFFNLLLIAGLFVCGLAARSSGDAQGFASFSLGMQMFSVIVFVPGALSSYFVPRLTRNGSVSENFRGIFVAYAKLGAFAFVVALVLLPILFAHVGIDRTERNVITYALIQVSALVAATNAAFNQSFVSEGRFRKLAALSVLWFIALVGSLALMPRTSTMVAFSVLVAYVIVLVAAAVIRAGLSGSRRIWFL